MTPLTRAAALAACLALAACGGSDESALPRGCGGGADTVLRALEAAPAPVVLAERTPVSACLARAADAAQVQQVGADLIGAAASLSPRAAREPEGREALRLGYLAGAIERRRAQTQGIYSEALRRFDQELIGVDRGSHAFRRGLVAGRSGG